MNCENYKDKIIAYIDNELNESDRISFEKELKSNSELNAEYTEMKDLLNSLKNLPEIKTSKNFMVSLNSKIDEYESSKNIKWYSVFDNIFSQIRPIQMGIGALSFIFILFIGYKAFEVDVNEPVMLSKSNLVDDESTLNISDSKLDSLLDTNDNSDSTVE